MFAGSARGKAEAIPRGAEKMAGGAAGSAIKGGRALCGSTESRTKDSAEGGATKRLDLGGDVATCRRESRLAPGSNDRTGGATDLGATDPTEPGGGSEAEDGGGGGGGGGIDEGGSTPHPRGVAPPSGVVQGDG